MDPKDLLKVGLLGRKFKNNVNTAVIEIHHHTVGKILCAVSFVLVFYHLTFIKSFYELSSHDFSLMCIHSIIEHRRKQD